MAQRDIGQRLDSDVGDVAQGPQLDLREALISSFTCGALPFFRWLITIDVW